MPWLGILEERSLLSLLTVTTAADSGPGSLRDTVLAANSNDVIDFSPALAGSTIPFGSEIVIGKNLTIQGLGAANLTLDGGGVTRLFSITEGNYADLSGLTLANGLAGEGGAVYMDGEGLVLSDCVFSNNTALGIGEVDGGGVEADAAVVSPGADGRGGALYVEDGYVSIFRTSFQGNHAQGADGGVLPDLAAGSIGATGILIEPAAGGGFGGAIAIQGAWLSVLDSTFAWNTAAGGFGLDVPGGSALNGGDGAGGAIHANDSLVSVLHTTFSSNSALGNTGGSGDTGGDGGVGVGGAISSHAFSTLVSVGCTFDSNLAVGGAGGHGDSESGWGGDGRGGAVENGHDSEAIISSTHFVNNAAQGGAGGDSADGGDGLGGAVSSLDNTSLTLTDSWLQGNRVGGGAGNVLASPGQAYGGGIYVHADSAIGTVATLAGVTLDGNQAWGAWDPSGTGAAFGGGIAVDGGAYLVMTGSTLSNNLVQGAGSEGTGGGGLNIHGGTAFLTNVQVLRNRVNGGYGAIGGGVANWHGTLYLTDSSICDNVALGGAGVAGGAGAFSLGGGLANSGSATIRGTTFRGNQAIGGDAGAGTAGGDAQGGGIYNDSWISQANTSVSNNLAVGGRGTRWVPAGSGRGGGVYVGAGALYSTYLGKIDANKAQSGGPGGVGEGGGLFVEPGGQATLRRTPVVHNWASTRGHNIQGPVNVIG